MSATVANSDASANTKKRSCENCPSFLKAHKVKSVFGATTSMDHCARFGTILGMPEMHPRNAAGLRRETASKCDSYALPRPSVVDWSKIAPVVAQPSRNALMLEAGREIDTPDKISNCKECVFYNRRGAEGKGIYGGGVCSIRMEFVFDAQVVSKAEYCGTRLSVDWRSNRTQINEPIKLSPELVDLYYKVMTPLQRWREERAKFVDPTEYETDRKVMSNEEARGIRAWRELIDNETGNSVFLPIYDREKFAPHLKALVPKTGDDEHPENFIDYDQLTFDLAALWYELDETPTLWGWPGTGKTEILRHMAWMMQLPFHRISITASTELEELVGQFALRERETVFVHGRLPRAWREPGVICLDEPNVGPPEVWQAIRPLTDNSKQFVIDKNGGEVIKRHDDSLLGLAMNPAYDTRNIGADLIADADSSRLAHLVVNYPPEDIEMEIMREWANDEDAGFVIQDSTLKTIVTISTVLREMASEGSLGISWGVRHNIKVAKAMRLFGMEKAYGIAAANFLDPMQREVLLNTVRAHMS